MLNITPDFQKTLGDAVLLVDGDAVYMSNGKWLLIITGAEHHVSPEVLQILRQRPNEKIDWRVLTAQSITVEAGKFLPSREAVAAPLVPHWYQFSSVTVEGCRSLIDGYFPSLWGEVVNLSELHASGQSRATYLRENDNPKRQFAKEPAAETFVFSFEGKVIGVPAQQFLAFTSLGATILCPKEHYLPKKDEAPPLGLVLEGAQPDVFGFLMALNKAGIVQDAQRRELYIDAAQVCWMSPEEGLEHLRHFRNYPLSGPQDMVMPSTATEMVQTTAPSELLAGVACLRWKGLTDQQINVLYEEGRLKAMGERLDLVLDQIYELEENSRRTLRDYEISRMSEDADKLYDMLALLAELLPGGVRQEDKDRLNAARRKLEASS